MTYACSISQVRTAEDCLRKWGFDKLDRVPRIAHPSAALGTAVHAQLEHYLRDAKPLDLTTVPGQIAMAGIHLLPPPPFVVEHRIDIELDGVPFVGFVDLLSPGVVHDHKTAGDLRYALTSDELQGDTQGTLYAHATHATELHWIYYRTRLPYKAIDVRAKVDRMKSDDRIARTIDTARTLRSIVLSPPPKGAIELPPNPAACDRYGGCPHKASGRCAGEFSDTERMRAFMSTASLLDQLSQRVNPPPLHADAPAAPPTTIPAEPPELQGGSRELPEGLFWIRGSDGWSIAPEAMRATLDPDGSKCWPRPAPPPNSIEALASDSKERAILALPTLEAQLDAALALGDAEDAAARSPLASVLESASAADAPGAPTDPVDALLSSAAPPKARKPRAPKAAAPSPDLDPRVRVLHDPDAAAAVAEPPASVAPPTSCAEHQAPARALREAIATRALALVPNASAAELVDLMAVCGGWDL